MLDFPASPTNGQLFTGANGVVYQWNSAGGLWLVYGVGTNSGIVGDTPPSNPVAGQLWFNSALGQLFVWYTDPNSSQWVPASPNMSQTYSTSWRQLGRVIPTAGQATVDFTAIPSDINDLDLRFDVTPTTNAHDLAMRFYDNTGTLDTAANYNWGINVSTSGQATGTNVTTNNAAAVTSPGGILLSYTFTNGHVSNTSGIRGRATINNIRDARWKGTDFQTNYLNDPATAVYIASGSGWRAVNGAITGLRLLWWQGSTFAAGGAVTLWGSP